MNCGHEHFSSFTGNAGYDFAGPGRERGLCNKLIAGVDGS